MLVALARVTLLRTVVPLNAYAPTDVTPPKPLTSESLVQFAKIPSGSALMLPNVTDLIVLPANAYAPISEMPERSSVVIALQPANAPSAMLTTLESISNFVFAVGTLTICVLSLL